MFITHSSIIILSLWYLIQLSFLKSYFPFPSHTSLSTLPLYLFGSFFSVLLCRLFFSAQHLNIHGPFSNFNLTNYSQAISLVIITLIAVHFFKQILNAYCMLGYRYVEYTKDSFCLAYQWGMTNPHRVTTEDMPSL